ncbi:MAG: prenyltransferase, partial [Planctomycetes bacterium]|nr:prenyltransferase [Planctomycetota bacterium]
YGDVRHGVDVVGAPTTIYKRHSILSGDFSAEAVLKMSLICYAASILIGGYFFLLHGWPIVLFTAAGILGGVCYTTGPKYKYWAMGEIAVFFIWGPLMMSACYFVHTGNWNQIGAILLISILHGLWVVLVLLANNLTDIEYDRNAGIKTLGTFLGKQKALSLYFCIVATIYIITGMEIFAGVIPVWGLLTCLSFPVICKFMLRMKREPAIPLDAEPQTAKAVTLYGILLIVAFLIDTYNVVG